MIQAFGCSGHCTSGINQQSIACSLLKELACCRRLAVARSQEVRLRTAQAHVEHPALLAGGAEDADALIEAVDGFVAAREAFEAAWVQLKAATGQVVAA